MKLKKSIATLGIVTVLASGMVYAAPPIVNPASVRPQLVWATAMVWLITCGAPCGGQRPAPR